MYILPRLIERAYTKPKMYVMLEGENQSMGPKVTYVVHEFKGPKENYNFSRVVHLTYSSPEAVSYINERTGIRDLDYDYAWEIVEVE